MNNEKKRSFKITDNLDVIVAFGVMAIVLMIIIPLPTPMVDFLIVVNLTIAMVIILTSLFTTEVLQMSVFPTLLLITTLFRVGINISSTRLILTQANAGEVISAFGNFVIGGNYVVGIIIFLIIVIVQFVVITSGSGRVAEVAARFTLDAMPGKQMSIDADLNAGLIDDMQAKDRRKKLQEESDFYGSMDGASKFVKGDAISSIIIVVINMIGGMIIGVVQLNMTATVAAQTYIKLSVGDGLVSQIPALLISVSTGIIVTRSGNNQDFGTQVVGQLTNFPKALGIASGVLFIMGVIPGFPTLVFLILAFACAVGAFLLMKEEKNKIVQKQESENSEIAELENKEPENVMSLVSVEPMEIEIGYGLIPLADESSGGDLLQRIASVRRQCAIEMGIVVQPIRIRDNLQLKTNEYVVKIRGTVVQRGELMPSMLLSMDSTGENEEIQGIKTIEPTFGLPAVWINKDQREKRN